MSKAVALTVIIAGLIVFGAAGIATAAQMEANINPNSNSSPIDITYQKTLFIEYGEGQSQIADLLRGEEWTVSVNAGPSDPGVQDLMEKINKKLVNDGSASKISDVNVAYSAHMTGRDSAASIDYKLELNGQLTNYVIREGKGQSPAIIDVEWRGITVTDPVTVDGNEINLLISPIQERQSQVYNAIRGSSAETVLNTNLIDASGIQGQPLSNWHFLFDPTGINVDAGTFGLSEEISGFVVSGYTMGESSIREGRQVEEVNRGEFTADKTYPIRTVKSSDSANIRVIGFANRDNLEGNEIFGVTPRAPEGYAETATGDFPVTIIYGMAGVAAIGAVAFFIFSSRQLKKEAAGGGGQTGIDPSQLKGYSTSAAAGGYQTNRGEAQLADDSDYEKTRSVYDEEQKDDSSGQSPRGSMPKGWKPE
ncbi:MAG: hypothetical protein GWN01_03455 [Nitrosopumilaceae archaeon]|nr:hypothetical protein [Nitrosopumilaceae archaeon]NIU00016.1 hypothetical protein [Nitrosopumilaceae archaeon]NIU86390.1 hypothetical protein [Nitrosopumilaceae archaeon]NIV66360.1 hypothetical protein [Nitrosopumilaceae archaeon]NIX60618.1 hypothetical protein [Nitrosopumilaceae archaeon]